MEEITKESLIRYLQNLENFEVARFPKDGVILGVDGSTYFEIIIKVNPEQKQS